MLPWILDSGGAPQPTTSARSGDIVNPAHIAFRAASRAQVRQFYAAALAAGANDNGAPGFRPQYHKYYYGAFVLDPSGYNIEALFHWPEGLLEWLGFLWHSLISILGGGGGGGGGGGRGAATPKDD
ncbi:hypothetical protein PLESTB_000380700 [Pleodorina starrii]|uniref:Glyoxalase/fosfomycin resistance/dioxygenase domain-containing protein n=1 Tax=Pleodorina starrii TaxID=330485 RepID=A0A9W6BFA2_9CHLO|nr:hypothetical protein PLESTB_000380700 [Pleodorina starrii]